MAEEVVPDFYDLLELKYDATDREIQKAFRRQAIKYHPDKNPTLAAATRFHYLTLALDTLSDPERRRKYDAVGEAKRAAELRRSKVEGERRAWIDELERSERNATQSQASRQRRQEENESREQALARKGARMRMELAAELRKVKIKPIAKKVPVEAIVSPVYTTEERTIRVRCPITTTDDALRTIFSKYGMIQAFHSTASSKFKLSLIEYTNVHDAYTAKHSSHHNLLIDWAYTEPRLTPTINDSSFETYVLDKLHQKHLSMIA